MSQAEVSLAYSEATKENTFIEACPVFHIGILHADQAKFTPESSLNLKKLRRGMVADASHVYTADGSVAPVKIMNGYVGYISKGGFIPIGDVTERNGQPYITRFDDEELTNIQGAFLAPVAPWWELGSVMHVNFSKEAYYAYHDYPPELEETIVTAERKALQYYQKLSEDSGRGGIACLGKNNYAGCVFPSKGGQTILSPHEQMGAPANPRSFQQIKEYRLFSDNPEAELNRLLASQIRERIDGTLHDFSPDAIFSTDNMGFTIELPGFEAQHFTVEAINRLFQPLFLNIHEEMRTVCAMVFEGDLNDKISQVSDARKNGGFHYDKTTCNEAFYKCLNSNLPPPWNLLNILERKGTLRHPPGWSFELRVSKKDGGGLVTGTLGIADGEAVGPVEGSGSKLFRPPTSPTLEQIERRKEEHRRVTENMFS